MAPEPPRGKQESWKHSFAGGVAGGTAVLALHPFDVIKTRLQVQDGHCAQSSTYRGAMDAARRMYLTEGWRAFYNGLTPAWLGSGVAWAAYFYVYESVKGMYWTLQGGGSERLSAGWHTLSAAQAGATVCLLTNPIWLIKTRLQLQQQPAPAQAAHPAAPTSAGTAAGSRLASAAGPGPGSRATAVAAASAARGEAAGGHVPYRGLVDAFLRIGREEGLRGYYKGLAPSLLLQTGHGAIQFTVYEELKAWMFAVPQHMPSIASRSGGGDDGAAAAGSSSSSSAALNAPLPPPPRHLSAVETSVAAALSKLSASVITYPSQVIRSRLQQRFDNRGLVYRSTLEAVRLTWRNEGLPGFYRGLGPALARTLPQSAITLTAYEKVLQVLPQSS